MTTPKPIFPTVLLVIAALHVLTLFAMAGGAPYDWCCYRDSSSGWWGIGEIENRLTFFVGEGIIQTVPVTRFWLCIYGMAAFFGLTVAVFKRACSENTQRMSNNV